MNAQRLERDSDAFPRFLLERMGTGAPLALHAMGALSLLRQRLLGLACSIQCPGSAVLRTFDAMVALRDAGVVLVGGFHSPMERDCLDILLQSGPGAVLVAAKGLAHLRLGNPVRQALRDGRMLVLSEYDQSVRRTVASQTVRRNALVAALAQKLFVPYARPGGRTWDTARDALAQGRSVQALAIQDNAELLALGAVPLGLAEGW